MDPSKWRRGALSVPNGTISNASLVWGVQFAKFADAVTSGDLFLLCEKVEVRDFVAKPDHWPHDTRSLWAELARRPLLFIPRHLRAEFYMNELRRLTKG